MSDSTSEVRCAAMLMLFDAYSAKCAEVEALRKALEQIANGDPSRVYSPIGALHAAGMVTQWEQDAAIARAALAARLADMTADRDMARRSLEELQQRWTENRPAAEYKARLAEAERTRANELAYVAEACIVATSQRDSHEARSHILDLRAWARSRASVPPYGAEIAASSADEAQR